MHPILLKFGPFTIYSYGVMVAMGFAVATFLAHKRAARFNIDPGKVIDIAIILIAFGILGARLLYVLLNLSFYIANPIDIVKLSNGGLVWYGGFISAFFAVIIYVRKAKLNFWAVADLFAPYVALAQAFGRIGCFFNGCCYGKDGIPVQIYSSIALLIIFIILRVWQDNKHFAGEIFLGYCVLYSLKRFLMEFLRGDNPAVFHGLTLSQVISVFVFFLSSAYLAYKAVQWKKAHSDSR
ncbi:MAG: prolipoprotein diacylglyceryl transferase [Candidatus Omnitrophota bacterium]|jgi:phosphatidylglycerol:prolipoprotein diacylglycerol transferase